MTLWSLHLIFIRIRLLHTLGMAVRKYCISRETESCSPVHLNTCRYNKMYIYNIKIITGQNDRSFWSYYEKHLPLNASVENISSGQRNPRSICTSSQSGQGIQCPLIECNGHYRVYQWCAIVRLRRMICMFTWFVTIIGSVYIGLDKMGYHVNIFLVSPWKHMLWVLIRSASARRF